MSQPSFDAVFTTGAGFRHGAIAIEAMAPIAEATDGEIDQAVGWPTIPATDRGLAVWAAAGGDQSDVGDATQVEHSSPASDAAQERCIGAGNEGCTLTAEGQIGSTKVMHHWSGKQMREERRLQQLPACPAPFLAPGSMPDRLPMASNELRGPFGVAACRCIRLGFGDRFR